MSGKAIKVRGADFSAKGLGQVTLLSNAPIEGMTMTATKIEANKYKLNITYTPSDTYQRDVTWEITAGEYAASISEDGILEIGLGALNTTVTVIATSEYDESITASYSGTFSYEDPMPITFTDNLYINASGVESADSNYYTSDFVAVTPLSSLTFANLTGNGFVIFYAENKATVTESRKTNQTNNILATSCYFRVVNKKGNVPTSVRYTDGDYLYYHPKAVLYGRNVIDVGEPATSFRWTTSLSDNKQILVYSADMSYKSSGSRRGTRTISGFSPFKYLVADDASAFAGDTLTVNEIDYTAFTYNTTIY